MLVKTNLDALKSYYNQQKTLKNISKSEKRLSTGAKFMTAIDDPGQFALHRRANINTRSLEVAIGNLEDGQRQISTLDEALNEADEILLNIRELVLQARNSTYSTTERDDMLNEVYSLSTQFTEVLNNAQYNGRNLLTNSTISITGVGSTINHWDLGQYDTNSATVLVIQHGFELDANNNQFVFDQNDTRTLNIDGNTDTTSIAAHFGSGTMLVQPFGSYGMSNYVSNFSDKEMLDAAYSNIETAIDGLALFRNDISRIHEVIEKKIEQRKFELQNLESYKSRLQDVDAAKEIINYTSNQILSQTGNAMLAQANTRAQQVLDLLR